jgi:hypothetical protein
MEFIRRSRPNMRKLLVMLFTFAVAFSLAMPVFAQDAGQTSSGTTVKKTKKAKGKKTKKTEETTTASPAPQQ